MPERGAIASKRGIASRAGTNCTSAYARSDRDRVNNQAGRTQKAVRRRQKAHDRTGAQRSIFGRGELVPERDDEARGAERERERQVHELRDELAVERVVEVRDLRAHDQDRDPAVVQPAHTTSAHICTALHPQRAVAHSFLLVYNRFN